MTRCKPEPRGVAPELATSCDLTSVAEDSSHRAAWGEEDRRLQTCSGR